MATSRRAERRPCERCDVRTSRRSSHGALMRLPQSFTNAQDRGIRMKTFYTCTLARALLYAMASIMGWLAYGGCVYAQDYPKGQPIRLVSPFQAGGGGDSVA